MFRTHLSNFRCSIAAVIINAASKKRRAGEINPATSAICRKKCPGFPDFHCIALPTPPLRRLATDGPREYKRENTGGLDREAYAGVNIYIHIYTARGCVYVYIRRGDSSSAMRNRRERERDKCRYCVNRRAVCYIYVEGLFWWLLYRLLINDADALYWLVLLGVARGFCPWQYYRL